MNSLRSTRSRISERRPSHQLGIPASVKSSSTTYPAVTTGTVDFESDLVDGTNLRVPGLPPLLFLNQNVAGERHRFNCAHELGHAVMHFSTALGDAEDEANAFASEFLMPRAEIRSDLRNLDLSGAARLKQVWGVSMAALITRARDLGMMTESTYRRMFTSLSSRGFRREEPLPVPFEQAARFDQLVAWHREHLRLDESAMNSLLFTSKLGPLEVPKYPPMRLATGTLFG